MSPVLSRGQPRQSATYHRTTTQRKHCNVLCQTLYHLVAPDLPGRIQKQFNKNVRERLIVYLPRVGPSKGPRIREEGVGNSSDKLKKTYYDMSVP